MECESYTHTLTAVTSPPSGHSWLWRTWRNVHRHYQSTRLSSRSCGYHVFCHVLCSWVNHLLCTLDPVLLLEHGSQLASWIECTANPIVTKLSPASFNNLLQVFSKLKLWNGMTSLLHSCNHFIKTINTSQLLEDLNSAVKQQGTSERILDILSMLSTIQASGISAKVRVKFPSNNYYFRNVNFCRFGTL